MNKADDFDNKIYRYFQESNKIPENFTNAIWDIKLKKEKNNFFDLYNFKKVAIISMSFVLITTGVVFAKDFSDFFKDLFSDNEGVNTAIANGYVYNVPESIYSESENIKTNITDMIMDDYTLDLNLIALLDNAIDVTGIESLIIPDLIITDNLNNILYCPSDEFAKEYCNQNGIDYSKTTKINTSTTIFISKANLNNMSFTCNLSAIGNKFPRSSEIYVTFNTMKLEGTSKKYTIQGKWKNKITVPEKFANRESTLYRVKSCNNKNVYIDSIKAEVYETGMNFEMYMYWGDYERTINKMDTVRKQSVLSGQLIKQEESYVENDNGKKFYPSQSSDGDGGYGIGPDGNLIKWETFNLTKFDMTNTLKVVLKTIDNKDIIIELQK